MNVIQTEVVFPIAYIVMHYYFISKNLFPNNIAGYSIGTRRKENLQSKITVMIYQPPFSRIFLPELRTSSREITDPRLWFPDLDAKGDDAKWSNWIFHWNLAPFATRAPLKIQASSFRRVPVVIAIVVVLVVHATGAEQLSLEWETARGARQCRAPTFTGGRRWDIDEPAPGIRWWVLSLYSASVYVVGGHHCSASKSS